MPEPLVLLDGVQISQLAGLRLVFPGDGSVVLHGVPWAAWLSADLPTEIHSYPSMEAFLADFQGYIQYSLNPSVQSWQVIGDYASATSDVLFAINFAHVLRLEDGSPAGIGFGINGYSYVTNGYQPFGDTFEDALPGLLYVQNGSSISLPVITP